MSLVFNMAGRLARLTLVAPAITRMKHRVVRNAIGAGLILVLGTLGVAYLHRVELVGVSSAPMP